MNASEIISKLLEHYGVSAKVFSEKIGKDRPQAIYDIQKGKSKSISPAMAVQIISVFPELNKSWLLTGEGDMLKGEMLKDSPKNMVESAGWNVKYYPDVDASMSNMLLIDEPVEHNTVGMNIPGFDGCIAINAFGDSMSPLINGGQIIMMKEWKESFVDWGKVYLIVTREGHRVIKYVMPSEDEGCIKCVSENKEKHPAFDVRKEDVVKMFIVKGWIRQEVM